MKTVKMEVILSREITLYFFAKFSLTLWSVSYKYLRKTKELSNFIHIRHS